MAVGKRSAAPDLEGVVPIAEKLVQALQLQAFAAILHESVPIAIEGDGLDPLYYGPFPGPLEFTGTHRVACLPSGAHLAKIEAGADEAFIGPDKLDRGWGAGGTLDPTH